MIYKKSILKAIILSIIILIPLSIVKPNNGHASLQMFNMSYLYFGNVNDHIDYVDRTSGALKLVSPSYFDLNEDGSLKVSNIFNENFIKEMHDRGIKVVPFLSNHWNKQVGKKALENRVKLTLDIVQFIEKYDLDGVHVDIENVDHNDRDNYTDFVKLLREELPQDKEVSIAVAANPRDFKLGWHASYDYEELAKYCDYLMIMAYDESYYGSKPGPIASIDFVENSIKYALERVPSSKVVLGIPFYGRYWNLNEDKGGKGIHLTDLDEVMEMYDANVVFDQESVSPKVVFNIEEGDSNYSIFGRELKPGEYVAWFENEISIKAKIDLVKKYKLKGTGSWSLGQELPNTWEYFTITLNDTESDTNPFYDIVGHWAEEDIINIKDKGWMNGFGNGIFMPNSVLTRAQAATTLVRAFELEKKNYGFELFDDVSENHWAKDEIKIAQEHGIIRGLNDNTFAPERAVTREEMTTMLDRVLAFQKVDTDLQLIYTDVSTSFWSYNSIFRMSFYGIIRGFEDETFRPKDNITRAQIATLLNRIEKYR